MNVLGDQVDDLEDLRFGGNWPRDRLCHPDAGACSWEGLLAAEEARAWSLPWYLVTGSLARRFRSFTLLRLSFALVLRELAGYELTFSLSTPNTRLAFHPCARGDSVLITLPRLQNLMTI
jgi:hypothetical protein